jgi:hypothetical protein
MAQRDKHPNRRGPVRSKGRPAQDRGRHEPGVVAGHWIRDEDVQPARQVIGPGRRRELEADRLYRRDYGPYDYGWASERLPERDRDSRRYGYGGETGHDTSWSGPSSAAYHEYAPKGPFAGRGPKGYQRSDSRIREDVCDRLTDAPEIDASDINVDIRDGEITLSGTVTDRNAKRRSEDLIETVTGVRDVHNNLRIRRPEQAAAPRGRK